MKRLFVIFAILAAVLVMKSVIKNKNQSSQELISKLEMDRPIDDDGMSKPFDGNCIRMEKFMEEYPDHSPEEFDKIVECNRERARRQGLDKPNTGFLGNTPSSYRPDGALAHYEGRGGRMFFTVYADHILSSQSKGISENIEIPFTEVQKVEKAWDMPGSVNIEYQNEDGNMMEFSIMLFGSDDMLKAEGATDLDRLIALLEKQRLEFQ